MFEKIIAFIFDRWECINIQFIKDDAESGYRTYSAIATITKRRFGNEYMYYVAAFYSSPGTSDWYWADGSSVAVEIGDVITAFKDKLEKEKYKKDCSEMYHVVLNKML